MHFMVQDHSSNIYKTKPTQNVYTLDDVDDGCRRRRRSHDSPTEFERVKRFIKRKTK